MIFSTVITVLYADFIIDEIGEKSENNGEEGMGKMGYFFWCREPDQKLCCLHKHHSSAPELVS